MNGCYRLAEWNNDIPMVVDDRLAGNTKVVKTGLASESQLFRWRDRTKNEGHRHLRVVLVVIRVERPGSAEFDLGNNWRKSDGRRQTQQGGLHIVSQRNKIGSTRLDWLDLGKLVVSHATKFAHHFHV